MASVHIEMCIFSKSIGISDDDDDSAFKVGLPTRVQMNSTKESQHTIYSSVSNVDSRSADSACIFLLMSTSFPSLSSLSSQRPWPRLLFLAYLRAFFSFSFFMSSSSSDWSSSFSFNRQSGKGCSLVSAYPCTIKRDNSQLYLRMTSNWLEISRILVQCGNTQWRSWFGRTDIVPWPRTLGEHSKTMRHEQRYCWQLQNHVWIHNLPQKHPKDYQAWKHRRFPRGPTTWKVMPKSVERYCEVANITTYCCTKYPLLVLRRIEIRWRMSDVCSQIVLKCLCLARIGSRDILCSINKLARAITKWTRASDKRLARFISYIHFTSGYRQYVMWEIQHINVVWGSLKTLTFQEIWKILNRLQVEHCEYVGATHLVL